MYGYRCPRYISRDFEIDRVRNTSRAIQKFHVCSSGRQCASFSPDRVREIEQNCWNQWSSFVQSLKIVTSGEKTLAYVPRANFDKIRIKPMVKLLFRDDRMAKFFKLKYKCVGKLNSFFKKKKNIYIVRREKRFPLAPLTNLWKSTVERLKIQDSFLKIVLKLFIDA